MSAAAHALPSLRPVGLLACGFLLLAGAALPAWRWSLGLRPEFHELLICAALPLLGLLALGWAGPARQVMLRIVCCIFMLPLLLLMWGSGLPRALPEPAALALPRLPETRLFAGALAQQDIPAAQLQGSGILLMRSAAFADGSELRLIRFERAEAARHYREQLAQVLRDAAPLAPRLAQHGADLLELRAATPALLQARWQALELPAAPPEAQIPPDERPVPFWPFGLAFVTAHLAFALGFLLWAGTVTTRLPPAPGRAAVTPALLGMRLRALQQQQALPLAISHDGEGRWRVEHRGLAAGRSHAALLRLDARRRRVQVRELLTADAAAPQDEEEASLRGSLADPAFDPARPRATHVWQKMAQTTMLEPARVAALRPGFEGDQLRLPAAATEGLDGEGMVTLLAALVTESGWAWQPVFWFSRR